MVGFRVSAALALAFTLGLGAAYAEEGPPPKPKTQDEAVTLKADELLKDPMTQIIGDPNGDVTIVQFFDYQCPFTKAAEPRLEAFLKSDPHVKLIVKEFPILSPESLTASKAALAAVKQGKYTAYHQAMLAHKGHLSNDDVFAIAKDVGLDVDALKRDMESPEILEELISNLVLARSISVTQTPTFIVMDKAGGHVITEPSATLDFTKLAADERAKAK
jgi:protein-disulfide isomerase